MTGTLVRMDDWIAQRGGLARAWRRLAAGPEAVAYLGTSVTAQRDGYRPRLHEWLSRHFGQAHRAVNAGIGGVGSISCVFLMNDMVLRASPALCFIECTTGDMGGKTTHADVGPAIEGMVRKLERIGCQACLLHLYRRDQQYDHGNVWVGAYERVADHYRVPSIVVGREVERRLSAGVVQAGELYRDNVHTTPAGSDLTAACIADGLLTIAASPAAPQDAAPDLLHADAWEHTAVVPFSGVTPPGTGVSRAFRGVYPYVELVNESAEFALSRDLKGLFVVVGPGVGSVRVTANEISTEHKLWDEWCQYDRLSTLIFEAPIRRGSRVRIEPLAGSHLRVIGLFVREKTA